MIFILFYPVHFITTRKPSQTGRLEEEDLSVEDLQALQNLLLGQKKQKEMNENGKLAMIRIVMNYCTTMNTSSSTLDHPFDIPP